MKFIAKFLDSLLASYDTRTLFYLVFPSLFFVGERLALGRLDTGRGQPDQKAQPRARPDCKYVNYLLLRCKFTISGNDLQ